MYHDKITPLCLRNLRRNILSPVIIESSDYERYFIRVLEEIPELDIIEKFMSSVRGKFENFLPQNRLFPNFRMISTILTRDQVFNLASNPNVKKIYPDTTMNALQYPVVEPLGIFNFKKGKCTTTLYTRKLLGADIAHQEGYTGKNVNVAVIDTGSIRVHPQINKIDLRTSIMAQPQDTIGHGSHVCTTIAGIPREDKRLSRMNDRQAFCIGMAPDARLISIKALGYGVGTGSTSSIISSIEEAVFRCNTKIINLSLGSDMNIQTPDESPFFKVFNKIVQAGAIPVCASGNSGEEGPGTINAPAGIGNCISVGAYDPKTGNLAPYSSVGPTPWGTNGVTTIAPGSDIDSGIVGYLDYITDGTQNFYGVLSGTSMATPHISGLLALAEELFVTNLNRSITYEDVIKILQMYGHPESSIDGFGVLNWNMIKQYVQINS